MSDIDGSREAPSPPRQGVGGFLFKQGSFDGSDVSGVKLAYAVQPGDWVTCYVDTPTEAQRAAGAELAKAAFHGWGTMGTSR